MESMDRSMMTSISDFDLSPEIVLGSEEHRRLLVMAMANSGHTADDADWLLHELERARLVPDGSVPRGVVRMGSVVRFHANGQDRTVQLVFPGDADIASGRVSVLTPIGTALIGLRAGQSITWVTRDGRKQVLTVRRVDSPENDGDPGPLAA
jgi:regulator of nucleoside diphosphate kinase